MMGCHIQTSKTKWIPKKQIYPEFLRQIYSGIILKYIRSFPEKIARNLKQIYPEF